MGYPRGIDEYEEAELHAEMDLRERDRQRGLCDYCRRRPSTPSCKESERHRDERIAVTEPCTACGGTGQPNEVEALTKNHCVVCKGSGVEGLKPRAKRS